MAFPEDQAQHSISQSWILLRSYVYQHLLDSPSERL
jgi:hypothetical protein